MCKVIIAIVGMLTILAAPTEVNTEPRAVVDRIEDGGYAVVEFSRGNEVYKMLDIPVEDINGKVSEGTEIPVKVAEGYFHCDLDVKDEQGNDIKWYQFRSYDDEVWWCLTEEEIGHIPTDVHDTYTLYYSDNGTTSCDCPAELECEEFLYDDIFFVVEKER